MLIGQPNVEERKIDNPLVIPNALSFLTYRAWKAEVQGLNAFPEDQWPTNIALLYFSYHIMVGLGTHLHRHRGGGRVPVVARQIVFQSTGCCGFCC